MSTEEDKARFDAQCFLTQMWLNQHKTMKVSPRDFRHIKEVSGDSSLLINQLTASDEWEPFQSMSSLHASFLTPMIRIWKQKGQGTKAKDVEFYFEKGSYNFKQGAAFSSIFSNQNTRGSDVGIESVDIEYLATQPAEVNNHIAVNLKLYFQNFNSLVKTRTQPGSNEKYRYADLILRPKAPGQTGGAASGGCGRTASSFQAEEYIIKLLIGWNLPQFGTHLSSPAGTAGAGDAAASIVKSLQKLASVDSALNAPKDKFGFRERKKLARAIRDSATLMHLTLKNHTFNFNMDGSFVLDIEYHAWVKASMAGDSSNIFFNHYAGRRGGDALAASVKGLQKQKTDRDKRRKATTPPGSKPGAQSEEDKEEEEEALEKRTQSVLKNKIAAYRRIFEAVEGKTQTLLIPKEAVFSGDSPGVDAATKCTEYKKFARLSDRGIGEAGKAKEVGNQLREAATEKKPSQSDLDSINEDNDDSSIETEDAAKWQEELSERMGLSGDFLQVHFVFLGHIIDKVYEKLAGDENPNKKQWLKNMKDVQIILGPANVENPCTGIASNPGRQFGGAAQAAVGGLSASASKAARGCKDNESLTLRVANMPVLWENFTVWFKNNIIKQQKDTYRFRSFLQDIFNGLVKPSLGAGCNEYAKKSGYNLNFDILDLGEVPSGQSAFKGSMKEKNNISVQKIRKSGLNRMPPWKKGPVSRQTMKQAVIMHLRASNYNRVAKKAQDLADGVYHITLGKGDGVIRTYSFSKNDAPYLAEAKTLGNGALGADLSGGAIYNFSCEMVGNGFFKPGQLIYVNPEQMQRYDMAENINIKEINLGGYYVVDSVKLSLKNGEFITVIDAIWQSSGGLSPSQQKSFRLKTQAEVKRLAGQNMSKYIYTSGG